MAKQNLVDAVRNGDSNAVNGLLASGVDANSRDASGMTALMQAAFFGWEDVTRLLLANGADAHSKDRLGLTAMDWAFRRGHSEVAALLNRKTANDGCQSDRAEESRSNGAATGTSSNKLPGALRLPVSHFPEPHSDMERDSLTFHPSLPPNHIEKIEEERAQEVEHLRAQLADAKDKIERLADERTAEVSSLALSLKDARNQLDEFQRDRALQAERLTTELRKSQQDALRLEEERKNEIAALQLSLNNARKQLTENEQERASEVNHLKTELSAANLQISQFVKKEGAGIASLKVNLEETQNQIKQVEQERALEVEQLRTELEETHRESEKIKKDRATEIERLALELNQARTKLEILEQEKASEVELLARELSKARREVDEVNRQKTEAVKLLELRVSEAQRNADLVNQKHGAEIEALRLELDQLQEQVTKGKDENGVEVLRSSSLENGEKGDLPKTSATQEIKELERQLVDALKRIEEAEQKATDTGRLNWELGEALRRAEQQSQQNAKEAARLKLELVHVSGKLSTATEQEVKEESPFEQRTRPTVQHVVGRVFSTEPPIRENRLVPALIIVGLLLGVVIGIVVNYQLFTPGLRTLNVSPKPAITEPTPELKRVTTGGMLQGKEISLIVPEYPRAAMTVGASGTVTVQVEIDRRGNVISARVLDGPSIFRSVAVLAARKSKFMAIEGTSRQRKLGGTIIYNFPSQVTDAQNDTGPTGQYSDPTN